MCWFGGVGVCSDMVASFGLFIENWGESVKVLEIL